MSESVSGPRPVSGLGAAAPAGGGSLALPLGVSGRRRGPCPVRGGAGGGAAERGGTVLKCSSVDILYLYGSDLHCNTIDRPCVRNAVLRRPSGLRRGKAECESRVGSGSARHRGRLETETETRREVRGTERAMLNAGRAKREPRPRTQETGRATSHRSRPNVSLGLLAAPPAPTKCAAGLSLHTTGLPRAAGGSARALGASAARAHLRHRRLARHGRT